MHNVLVIAFNRRTDPKGVLRRMICTKSNFVLTSFQGRSILNYRAPKYGGPKFDEAKHNVVIVWDILTQDYRVIPCETVSVMQIVSEIKFWEFYNNVLMNMSKKDKIKFMNTAWKK